MTYEKILLALAWKILSATKGVSILGPDSADEVHGCISFTVDGLHPHDLTQLLSEQGIALRAGHHCTQPLHQRLGIIASTRLSVGIYNTLDDIEAFGTALNKAIHKLTAND